MRVGRGEFIWRELELRKSWIGSRTVSGVFRRLSDKFFNVKVPITDLDIAHARATPRFVQCHMPSVEVTDVRRDGRWAFVGEWRVLRTDSCVGGQTYSIESVTWRTTWPTVYGVGDAPPFSEKDEDVAVSTGGTSSRFMPNPFAIKILTSVELVYVNFKPDNEVNYGGSSLPVTAGYTLTLSGSTP